jgi:subtilisin family serine protease
MLAPRLLLILALAGFPAAVRAGTETAPNPELPAIKSSALLRSDVEETPGVVVSPQTAAALEKAGWKAAKDGRLVRVEGPERGVIPLEYLEKANIKWKDGALIYAGSPEVIEYAMYAPLFRGLSSFTAAAQVNRKQAGAALAAWGFPPSVDGRRLYNPAGDATYYGIMLHSFFATKPEQVATLGMERTSQAIDLLDHAYGQAFYKQAPDIAQTDLDRARLLLFMRARGGETPLNGPQLKARPDPAVMLKDYKDKLQADLDSAIKAGDEPRRKDSAEALAVLNTLERQRSHEPLDLTLVPRPGEGTTHQAGLQEPKMPVGPDFELGGGKPKDLPYAPLASGLPGLLRVLERVNGAPLTADQQENLIKSFPMGDLVWRMGAQDLWKQGLTGKGVKVAVIDGGIAEHAELDASVKARANFTDERGRALSDMHGTHVAGIIHALAPDAELRGYTVFAGGDSNPALRENPDEGVIAAIRRAVSDGNQIINMSLGSGAGPSDQLARVVEEYASKGVIFVVAAGNSRDRTGGIDNPSSAPSAITVGALDSNGRMADYTNFGERFDPKKLVTAVKDVFLTPGSNIVSTVPATPFGSIFGKEAPRYQALSGTSMATPAMSGVTALLVQDMSRMSLVPSPIEAAQRLKAALVSSSEPISLDKLPPGVPIDQPFFVVKPLKALEALRASAVPVASK